MPITKYYEVDILGEIKKFTEEQLFALRADILTAFPIEHEKVNTILSTTRIETSKLQPPSIPITAWYKDKDTWRCAIHGSVGVSVVNEVYNRLKELKSPINADELCAKIGISKASTRRALYVLIFTGVVYQTNRGIGMNTKNVYGLRSDVTISHNDEIPKIDTVPEGTDYVYPSLKEAYQKERDMERNK